ncbi:MAG: apolipoprotein N-acyltransferase [Bacteroidales bacterium]|nr:apolipoprotein N-acyltransferase [Bacteroidales bacterium]MCF8390318.1 apolipoprotein N-acyltransferase [Bacteroidales bacterium]
MNSKQRIYFSIASALLFIPPWYSFGKTGLLLLIAFIPMLLVQKDLLENRKKSYAFFWLPFLTFLVWNLGATWWIKNASFMGLIAALLVNSTMMTLPFWLSSLTHRKLGKAFGYFSLLFFWIAMEHFYLKAEISWTWLNLGNGLANNIKLIQWYEYTGVLGGTLWIVSINLLLFKIVDGIIRKIMWQSYKFEIILSSVLFILPVTFSIIKFHSYKETENPYQIAVVQPNIDPYSKFNDIPSNEQMQIFLNIADSLCDENTDYLVAPETFINNNLWLNDLENNVSIIELREFVEKYPGIKIVIGATTYMLYDNPDVTPTARPFRGNTYYDSFNTALQVDSTSYIPYYHKSQLVVGVEKMPYTQYLGFLQKLTLRLGGTFRSHGTQDYRDSFESSEDGLKVGPVICYESIFGEYVSQYVKDAGANFIFVITNDGWWGDTPGYVQHNSFSSIRAIENRRSIARSANTGISAFFNQKGEIIDSLGWWKRGGLKATLNANQKLSFYTLHGDFIGRISAVMTIMLLLYTMVRSIIGKFTSSQ